MHPDYQWTCIQLVDALIRLPDIQLQGFRLTTEKVCGLTVLNVLMLNQSLRRKNGEFAVSIFQALLSLDRTDSQAENKPGGKLIVKLPSHALR